MISNIPIFRAKKIDSDEYVEGYYQTETGTNVEDKNNMFPTLRHIIVDLDKHQLRLDLFGDGKLHNDSHIREQYEIDPTTLSISFPDMLDSQGNKIFASLQEDGKGGDILQSRGYRAPCIFNKGFTVRTVVGVCNFYMLADRLKVIGIQE